MKHQHIEKLPILRFKSKKQLAEKSILSADLTEVLQKPVITTYGEENDDDEYVSEEMSQQESFEQDQKGRMDSELMADGGWQVNEEKGLTDIGFSSQGSKVELPALDNPDYNITIDKHKRPERLERQLTKQQTIQTQNSILGADDNTVFSKKVHEDMLSRTGSATSRSNQAESNWNFKARYSDSR